MSEMNPFTNIIPKTSVQKQLYQIGLIDMTLGNDMVTKKLHYFMSPRTLNFNILISSYLFLKGTILSTGRKARYDSYIPI